MTTEERALGRYWGAGRFSRQDASAIRIRIGRATAAKLIGALQLLSERGTPATRLASKSAVESLRSLGTLEREWLLTHPITSGLIRDIQDAILKAQASASEADLLHWMNTRFADLLRGAKLVSGQDLSWDAVESSVVPGIGLRLRVEESERVSVRFQDDRMMVSRASSGIQSVPVSKDLAGFYTAVDHPMALASFILGGSRIHLDAEDPAFRDRWVQEVRFGVHAVQTPSDEKLGEWITAMEAAAKVAESTVPLSSGLFGTIVRSVVPIVSPDPSMGCSLSDRDLPGAIMTTIDGPAVLAENLLHEFRHNLLHQLEQCYPLYLSDSPKQAKYYSPWRNDPRPLHGILHALFVFLDVCAVHAGVRSSSLAHEADLHDSAVRLAANVSRIGIALEEFRSHAHTTEFGTGFVEGIEDAVDRFRPLIASLPPEALGEAREQVESHRAAWIPVA